MLIATREALKTLPLPAEFEALFLEHYDFVHRTAYRVTGNFADAEDVIQTLFLRLCRRELPAELRTNPRGYLYRAAVNASLDVKWIRDAMARVSTELDVAYRAELEELISKVQRFIDDSRTQPTRVDADAFFREKDALDKASMRLHEIAIAQSLRGDSVKHSAP